MLTEPFYFSILSKLDKILLMQLIHLLQGVNLGSLSSIKSQSRVSPSHTLRRAVLPCIHLLLQSCGRLLKLKPC